MSFPDSFVSLGRLVHSVGRSEMRYVVMRYGAHSGRDLNTSLPTQVPPAFMKILALEFRKRIDELIERKNLDANVAESLDAEEARKKREHRPGVIAR